ncbi:CheR family methyltransferase [Massilia cavernae]|uniref:Methyltransferase n=1 Tax=Massilia cavernae TaxID=2320864 RepID=A0A418X7N4_9BURK|nr:CheR family methyltransferase [Massilia cavernae]RJG08506.1 methyltransferase [Massilia cavernae]
MSVRDLIQRETGLDLSEAAVDRAVQQRMAPGGASDPAAYLAGMTPAEFKALTELLVVPESWMFRDADAFIAATAFVQRLLAQSPGRIVRILSVPCAGGEEPYSMAMALADAGVPSTACTIDAVDLSDAALERARLGRYTRNAFRGQQLAFRDRYFTREGSQYLIRGDMRARVRFSQGNLLTASSAAMGGRFDVVFCRNLLIYFDEATAAAAIARLSALLADDGLLLAGYAEVPAYCRNGYATVRSAGAFALQKAPHAAPVAAARPRAPRAARHSMPAAPAAAVLDTPARPRPQRAAAPAAAPAPDYRAVLAQARTQADQGNYEGAAAACGRVLEAMPDAAEAFFILGLTSECEGKPAAAAEFWRRCVYLQPDHYEALCHLALLAGERGDAAQADAFRQRAARVWQRAGDSTRKGAR